MGKQYEQLSEAERRRIERLRGKGRSLRRIAKTLDRSISTISEEIKRGKTKGKYRALRAQQKARLRRMNAKQQCLKVVEEPMLREYVQEKLQSEWSPELISGRLKHIETTLPYASTKAIYAFVRSVYGRPYERYLHRKLVPRHGGRKRGATKTSEGRLRVAERPKKVALRKEFGHFEGDFIESGKNGRGSILVLVERKTRYPFLTYVEDRTTFAVNGLIGTTLAEVPIRSLTLDNDISFQKHEDLSAILRVLVYFTTPYTSQEKGTVENRNKAIRRWVPKRADCSAHQDLLPVAENALRNRPMKCLGFLTPREKWEEEIKRLQRQKQRLPACGNMKTSLVAGVRVRGLM